MLFHLYTQGAWDAYFVIMLSHMKWTNVGNRTDVPKKYILPIAQQAFGCIEQSDAKINRCCCIMNMLFRE